MGGLTYEASFQRTQGVKNIIESTYPDVKVLAEETAEWQREKAVSVVENWITAYGEDIDAIFANNDEMALGAIMALQAAGINDVMVFGIDATPDAVKAVEDGTLTATVFQDAKGQSEGAMDFALKAIKPVFEMVADVNEDNARQACEKLGYRRFTTDWMELV
ncbi:MAG: hypothetical protein EOM70_13185, partial [Clostridia bacterium]|nr:hypothetical protein [Clostridia bacterium]